MCAHGGYIWGDSVTYFYLLLWKGGEQGYQELPQGEPIIPDPHVKYLVVPVCFLLPMDSRECVWSYGRQRPTLQTAVRFAGPFSRDLYQLRPYVTGQGQDSLGF